MRARSGDALDRAKAPEPFANLVPTREHLAHQRLRFQSRWLQRLRTLNATVLGNESAFRQEIDRTASASVFLGPHRTKSLTAPCLP